MIVTKYSLADRKEWNEFIQESKNSSFLFSRDFLEYHSDRFEDYSLVVREENRVIAVLPANISANKIISHQGLTYGAVVFNKTIKLRQAIAVFYHLLKYLAGEKVESFELKMIPAFLSDYKTDDTEYILFLLSAELFRRDVAIVVDYRERIPYSGNIRREGNNAAKAGVTICYDDSSDTFWLDVLEPNLLNKFGVKPVHSLPEIRLLKERFPKEIVQVNAYKEGKVAAGTLLFKHNRTVHCQYISSTEEGRKSGCLNYLFKTIIDDFSVAGYNFFDFGIVNEQQGRFINTGMLFWKEGFGGRSQKHDFYTINTANYLKLEQYL